MVNRGKKVDKFGGRVQVNALSRDSIKVQFNLGVVTCEIFNDKARQRHMLTLLHLLIFDVGQVCRRKR